MEPQPQPLDSLIEQRKAKLAALRAKGIDPFKNKFTPSETCHAARANYVEGREVAVAGRITAHRDMGKSMFIDVRDQSGRIQVYAQKNVLGDEQWNIFTHLDLGDFIGARGTLFTTKTGEISIKLASFTILAKSLRPPPAKYYGLEDTEIRYRQRYLDLIANPQVKDVMLMRSEIIREIRNFLHDRGFVEVETPMMQAIPGGAAAQPFVTHHNALGCNFYLRIALELYLKRLLVGGIDRVFEIGRNFRNEGLSRKHNPEFTMLEAYQAYGDYESMMELVQGLVCHVAERVIDSLVITNDRTELTRVTIQNIIDKLEKDCAEVFRIIISKSNDKSEAVQMLVKNFEETSSKLKQCLDDIGKKPSHEIARKANEELVLGAIGHASAKIKAQQLGVFEQNQEFRAALNNLEKSGVELRTLCVEKTIDLTPPWRRVKYKELVRERIRPDWFELSTVEKLAYAEQVLHIDVGGRPKRKMDEAFEQHYPIFRKMSEYAENEVKYGQVPEDDKEQLKGALRDLIKRNEYVKHGVEDFEITQSVFEKLIEPTLIQPTFVTHLPKELVPLAKLSDEDPSTVEVFECCINGQEIAPAYTEQNDPIEQRERLEHQAGGEQQKLDEDFLVALEHGMPPAGGMGMGIDRLCMMLLGQESIRDVILFPQLKPKVA